jgi:hypothetical protein
MLSVIPTHINLPEPVFMELGNVYHGTRDHTNYYFIIPLRQFFVCICTPMYMYSHAEVTQGK